MKLDIISDIYEHTIKSILIAEKLGGFKALPASDIFDIEYWDLEQAKLLKNTNSLEFQGEIVLITGAASGIGKSCVQSFLYRGAAVVGIDIDSSIKTNYKHKNYLGLICDVTDEECYRRNAREKCLSFWRFRYDCPKCWHFPRRGEMSVSTFYERME